MFAKYLHKYLFHLANRPSCARRVHVDSNARFFMLTFVS